MTEPVRPLEALIAEMLKVYRWRAVDWPSPDSAERNCWIVTDYEGGGIRGIFQSQRDAEAEIAAICADHEDLARRVSEGKEP
jgi:hypothetical protein